MRFDVVALGELLIDFTPYGVSEKGTPLYETNPGGAPCNALTAVVRQGGTSAFIGKVGQDYFGSFLANTLEQAGVNIEGLSADANYPTTLAIVSLDEKGDRSFGFYRNHSADVMLTSKEVRDDIIKESSLFHFGSLSLTNEPSRSATLHALEVALKNKLYVSYDPNIRMPLWENEEQAKEQILSALPYADILKIGKDEFTFLFDTKDYEGIATQIMNKYKLAYLFITNGEHGTYYQHNGYSGLVPSYNVTVVDTTGAGDAFTGTVIYHLSQLSTNVFYALPQAQLEKIVQRANATGALATTQYGGMLSIPTAKDVDNCIL